MPRKYDDDDEDDLPPKRKRRSDDDDDDDDEPRPKRRSRRDDDDDDDDDDRRSIRKKRSSKLSRETLRSIAIYQKVVLLGILVYLVSVVVQFVIPAEFRWVLGVIVLPAALGASVFVFLLSTKIYGVGLGILLGLLTLIPCIGLLVLLIINGRATSTLKSHGIEVGFLGADLSDLR